MASVLAFAFAARIKEDGNRRLRNIVNVTLDGDYPVAGWTITAAQLGLSTIESVKSLSGSAIAGHPFYIEYPNTKSITLRFYVHDADGTPDGPLALAPDSYDALNDVVMRLEAEGY